MLQPRSLESLAPRLVGRDGKPLVKNGVIDQQAVDDYLSEEELLDGADDEADMSILPQEVTNSPHGHRIAQTRLLFQELMIGGGGVWLHPVPLPVRLLWHGRQSSSSCPGSHLKCAVRHEECL